VETCKGYEEFIIQGVVSHLCVACNVCDQDQNEIKQSMFLLGADQGLKTNSNLLISTDQHILSDTKEAW